MATLVPFPLGTERANITFEEEAKKEDRKTFWTPNKSIRERVIKRGLIENPCTW